MLFVIDLKEKRSFLTVPANVGVETDFHRTDVEGYAPDALETSLGIWEGKASEAFRRIIAAKSISNTDDRAYLLNLMALLAVKSPRHRENFRQLHEQLAKSIVGLATATPERWASEMKRMKAAGVISQDAPDNYEQMRQLIEDDKYKVNLMTNFHLYLELEIYKDILQYLARRKWVLFRAPPGKTGFITSDHPICLMWSDRARRRQFKGPGHGVVGTQVLFPISTSLRSSDPLRRKSKRSTRTKKPLPRSMGPSPTMQIVKYMRETAISPIGIMIRSWKGPSSCMTLN